MRRLLQRGLVVVQLGIERSVEGWEAMESSGWVAELCRKDSLRVGFWEDHVRCRRGVLEDLPIERTPIAR